ncbi:hypothetical protein Nepgr_019607 [Nepenthes gracilis]|uniref:Uncharacterized protein n=1 Tax=Nepenthes gracilis TaxID=150966 RepID=A0AAD3SXD9_NEPGR|nr:hypothetical protein Nepgr_019607 [Nepenthes gracilis]
MKAIGQKSKAPTASTIARKWSTTAARAPSKVGEMTLAPRGPCLCVSPSAGFSLESDIAVRDNNLPLPEEAGTTKRPADDGYNLVDENRAMDLDSDDVSSQSSEGWSAEDIAKDPIHYVLQCFLLEKATQHYVCSIDKDLWASRVVEETCLLDRMENVGTWVQAKSKRKRKVSPKHSMSSLGLSPGL